MELPPGPRTPPALNIAIFAARPLQTLLGWQRRYGNVFTVKFIVFGTGVYVADPDAIKELLTGDQSDLLAGEANSFMTPVLGSHSVLVLDGPEHMRQRKLLLPPFQGSRVNGFREVMREVAEREVAGMAARRADRAARADAGADVRGDLPCRVRRDRAGPRRAAAAARSARCSTRARCTSSTRGCGATSGGSAPGGCSSSGCAPPTS